MHKNQIDPPPFNFVNLFRFHVHILTPLAKRFDTEMCLIQLTSATGMKFALGTYGPQLLNSNGYGDRTATVLSQLLQNHKQ